MPLFDDFSRTNFNYQSHAESTYDFYNRTALPEFVIVRQRLEKWFYAYPDEAKTELKRNLQNDFEAAFYELFLYTLFLENGFTVELHSDVPNSTNKPDFFVSKKELKAYIEARVVHEVTANESSERNLKKRIYDKINEIKSDYFHITLDELDLLDKSKPPSLREINRFVQEALSNVNYEDCLDKIRKNDNQSFGNIPQFKLHTSTVRLTISVLPKPIPSFGKQSTLICVYADEGKTQMVNPAKALVKALNEKAKKYGQLDIPFIIAINALSPWVTYDEDYSVALFGSETLVFDPTHKVYLSAHGSTGFFIGVSGFRYSRVSGVLFTKAHHSSVSGSTLIFYHNPKAAKPVELGFLSVKQRYIDENSIKTVEGMPTASLFNVGIDE